LAPLLNKPFDNLSSEEKARLTKLSVPASQVLHADIFAAAGASWFHEKPSKASKSSSTTKKEKEIFKYDYDEGDTPSLSIGTVSSSLSLPSSFDTSSLPPPAEYEERCMLSGTSLMKQVVEVISLLAVFKAISCVSLVLVTGSCEKLRLTSH